MNTLTVNLHLLLASFYKPTAKRFKILFEEKCFPSDRYMFTTQTKHHGLDPSTTLIPLAPRKHEFSLRHQDILDVIEREGDAIAIVLFAGVQYYTGQLFDMAAITKAAKAKVRSYDHRSDRSPEPLTGLHRRLGSRPRRRQCPALAPRLGRRLRRVVHV
jgi:kynureninase